MSLQKFFPNTKITGIQNAENGHIYMTGNIGMIAKKNEEVYWFNQLGELELFDFPLNSKDYTLGELAANTPMKEINENNIVSFAPPKKGLTAGVETKSLVSDFCRLSSFLGVKKYLGLSIKEAGEILGLSDLLIMSEDQKRFLELISVPKI